MAHSSPPSASLSELSSSIPSLATRARCFLNTAALGPPHTFEASADLLVYVNEGRIRAALITMTVAGSACGLRVRYRPRSAPTSISAATTPSATSFLLKPFVKVALPAVPLLLVPFGGTDSCAKGSMSGGLTNNVSAVVAFSPSVSVSAAAASPTAASPAALPFGGTTSFGMSGGEAAGGCRGRGGGGECGGGGILEGGLCGVGGAGLHAAEPPSGAKSHGGAPRRL
mmetsp:Transcript_34706/g.81327  ORF Transcript_34706/g.81327 Transcript_34706/m.81327 type:complete len:227 (+) Transcript_34706:260-940(+)